MGRRCRIYGLIIFILIIVSGVLGCTGYQGTQINSSYVKGDTVTEHEEDTVISDGEYEVPVELTGGTGKASVASPARVTVSNGEAKVTIVFSSDHYDYMNVDGIRYLPLEGDRAVEGHSVFEIPAGSMEDDIDVIADTTAMSKPHEIGYTLKFDWSVITGETRHDEDAEDVSVKTDSSNGGIAYLEEVITARDNEGTLIPLNITGPDGEFIEFDKTVKRSYAKMFSAAFSDEGFVFVHIEGSGDHLIVPEGITAKDVSTGTYSETVYEDDEEAERLRGDETGEQTKVSVLCKPFDDIYLVSSSAMDIAASLDANLSDIAFCGLDKKDWYVDEAVKAMDGGTLKYAGKYSAPDYELLLSGSCDLAVENTMVYHKPEVIEKLNALGIPVIVDVSSYEPHPLGRMEWIKLYGVIEGRFDTAEDVFEEKLKEAKPVIDANTVSSGDMPRVAFFYVTSNGAVNVRKSNDYISRMISMAGGKYIPEGTDDDNENALSTVNMQMEAFYAEATDADILIYNGTVDDAIGSIDELIAKDKLFADFKAVKNGRVYTTDDDLYQKTMSIPELILDLNLIFSGEDGSEDALVFLHKVE
ncbi:MAG: ABC transporter substrate-binding protein [Lachnospiraceae bacterium]|nr:ABC transporter substrate-binding protein [Lachnospiraceae bacterium]